MPDSQHPEGQVFPVRPEIAARAHVTEARYRDLMAVVDEHCPVLDIVANPVPVERVLEVRPSA